MLIHCILCAGPEKLAQQRQLREAEGAGDPASQPLRQDGKAQRQTAASIAQRHKKQPSPEAGGTSQAVGDAVEPSDSDSDDGGPAAEDLGGGAGGARSFLHEVLAVDEVTASTAGQQMAQPCGLCTGDEANSHLTVSLTLPQQMTIEP
jgi:hypothetical protein